MSTLSTRTLGKSFGKRRSKGIRRWHSSSVRVLTGVNTWPSTRLEAAGDGIVGQSQQTRRRRATMFFALPDSDSKSKKEGHRACPTLRSREKRHTPGRPCLQPGPRSTKVSRTPMLFLAAIVAGAPNPSRGGAQGAGRYVEVEYPPSAAPGELQVGVTYILWDSGGRPLAWRGVIVHQHGAGRNAAQHGATAAYDLHWQALAKKWKLRAAVARRITY